MLPLTCVPSALTRVTEVSVPLATLTEIGVAGARSPLALVAVMAAGAAGVWGWLEACARLGWPTLLVESDLGAPEQAAEREASHDGQRENREPARAKA